MALGVALGEVLIAPLDKTHVAVLVLDPEEGQGVLGGVLDSGGASEQHPGLPEQIERFGLPTRPTKTKGTHAKGFEGESVELDAIPAAALRAMVEERIESHVDWAAYQVVKAAERDEKNLLTQWAHRFGSADAGGGAE